MVNSWAEKDLEGIKMPLPEVEPCAKCKSMPRNPPHAFCSRTCAKKCLIPDCDEQRFKGSEYCSQPHRKAAVKMGLALPCARCGTFPQNPDSQYCGKTCTDQANQGGSRLRRAPPNPVGPGDRRVPRPPQPHLKPRSAYQISFGEFKGNPSFLLRSKKGLAWANIPNPLHRLCKLHNMAEYVLDFSLGTEGKFYFVYKDGNEVKMETSPNLWRDLDEDFRGGSIRQIQFGVSGTVWGIKSYRQYRESGSKWGGHTPGEKTLGLGLSPLEEKSGPNELGLRRTRSASPMGSELPYTVQEEPFGSVPDSLMIKSAEIYPGMQHYGQVDFVAVGMGGAWVIGVMGKLCFWDKIEGGIVQKIARVYSNGDSLRNVALSPVRTDIYLLEAKDGTVQYRVPDEWHAQIKQHFHPSNALEMDPPGLHPHHRPHPKHAATGSPSGSGFVGKDAGGGRHSVHRQSQSQLSPPSQFGPPPPQFGPPPQQFGAPPQFAPPAYVPYVPPPSYRMVDPNTIYATNAPSSGVIQSGGSSMKKEILVACVKSAPAVLNAGVTIVGLAGGGCTIM